MSAWLTVWLTGLGVIAGLMVVVWLISLALRDASIIDVCWGPGFALLAWLYLALIDETPARGWLGAGMVTLWGARLAAHILWRSRGQGEDYRYREMREKVGDRFPLVSLFTVFLLQAGLLWLISAPLLQVQTTPTALGRLDVVAVAVFVVGFLFEAIGDLQLSRFRSDPANRGKVLRTGLWRYTRHPNYFGDAVVWWGFFLLAMATPGSIWTVFSPLLMTFLLLKVSGVALLEKKLERSRPEYENYVSRTNAFFPWFPREGQGRQS